MINKDIAIEMLFKIIRIMRNINGDSFNIF